MKKNVIGFEVEDAVKYGVEGAILLSFIRFNVEHNTKNNVNMLDGKFWYYHSYQKIADYYRFWSQPQVKRIMTKLVNKKAIIKNKSKKTYKANWYTLNDSELPLINDDFKQTIQTNSSIPSDEIVQDKPFLTDEIVQSKGYIYNTVNNKDKNTELNEYTSDDTELINNNIPPISSVQFSFEEEDNNVLVERNELPWLDWNSSEMKFYLNQIRTGQQSSNEILHEIENRRFRINNLTKQAFENEYNKYLVRYNNPINTPSIEIQSSNSDYSVRMLEKSKLRIDDGTIDNITYLNSLLVNTPQMSDEHKEQAKDYFLTKYENQDSLFLSTNQMIDSYQSLTVDELSNYSFFKRLTSTNKQICIAKLINKQNNDNTPVNKSNSDNSSIVESTVNIEVDDLPF